MLKKQPLDLILMPWLLGQTYLVLFPTIPPRRRNRFASGLATVDGEVVRRVELRERETAGPADVLDHRVENMLGDESPPVGELEVHHSAFTGAAHLPSQSERSAMMKLVPTFAAGHPPQAGRVAERRTQVSVAPDRIVPTVASKSVPNRDHGKVEHFAGLERLDPAANIRHVVRGENLVGVDEREVGAAELASIVEHRLPFVHLVPVRRRRPVVVDMPIFFRMRADNRVDDSERFVFATVEVNRRAVAPAGRGIERRTDDPLFVARHHERDQLHATSSAYSKARRMFRRT